MTREDIKRLAHESGLIDWFNGPSHDYLEFANCLNDFAFLVAAAERERMVADGWRQCAVGQKTTQFCGLAEEAVAAERDACAKVCVDLSQRGHSDNPIATIAKLSCAAAIRARNFVPHGTQGELK